jgi:ABC-type xylose transport system permease subunit
MHINAIFRAAALRAVGPDPMNFFRGWTLVFAILVSTVVGDAFGIWMGWLSTH